MAILIHRQTKQVSIGESLSVDRDIYFVVSRNDEEVEAIEDFKNLVGAAVPSKYWNLVDGPPKRILEMDRHEKDAVDESFLPQAKEAKFVEIDIETADLISRGFEFPEGSGVRYSLSAHAQINMTALLIFRNEPVIAYPVKFNSADNVTALSLNDASEVEAFYERALATVREIVDEGTELKEAVRAATTRNELDSIVREKTEKG